MLTFNCWFDLDNQIEQQICVGCNTLYSSIHKSSDMLFEEFCLQISKYLLRILIVVHFTQLWQVCSFDNIIWPILLIRRFIQADWKQFVQHDKSSDRALNLNQRAKFNVYFIALLNYTLRNYNSHFSLHLKWSGGEEQFSRNALNDNDVQKWNHKR